MLSIKIDGETFRLPIPRDAVEMSADFLEKSAYRTEDGVVHIVNIGLYEIYQITTGRFMDRAEYQRLYRKLTEAKRIHTIILPGVEGERAFRGYFSGIKHKLRRRDKTGRNDWAGLSFRVTPEGPR